MWKEKHNTSKRNLFPRSEYSVVQTLRLPGANVDKGVCNFAFELQGAVK